MSCERGFWTGNVCILYILPALPEVEYLNVSLQLRVVSPNRIHRHSAQNPLRILPVQIFSLEGVTSPIGRMHGLFAKKWDCNVLLGFVISLKRFYVTVPSSNM